VFRLPLVCRLGDPVVSVLQGDRVWSGVYFELKQRIFRLFVEHFGCAGGKSCNYRRIVESCTAVIVVLLLRRLLFGTAVASGKPFGCHWRLVRNGDRQMTRAVASARTSE
jgi:hypothetical protein